MPGPLAKTSAARANTPRTGGGELSRVFCRVIGAGAIVTGAIMVLLSRTVEPTNEGALSHVVVHASNLKFMAAMWCVLGAIFVVAADHLGELGTWRLIRLACVGISLAAVVRIVEMARLDQWSGYGLAAASVELVIPATLIFFREQAYGGVQR